MFLTWTRTDRIGMHEQTFIIPCFVVGVLFRTRCEIDGGGVYVVTNAGWSFLCCVFGPVRPSAEYA